MHAFALFKGRDNSQFDHSDVVLRIATHLKISLGPQIIYNYCCAKGLQIATAKKFAFLFSVICIFSFTRSTIHREVGH